MRFETNAHRVQPRADLATVMDIGVGNGTERRGTL